MIEVAKKSGESAGSQATTEPGDEKRSAPRVAMGRPAKVNAANSDNAISASCGIVDMSVNGCRIALPHRNLPREWSWPAGEKCGLTIDLTPSAGVTLKSEIVWSQRHRDGFDIVGFRFDEIARPDLQEIDQFILDRLRSGFLLPETDKKEKKEETTVLETPLQVTAEKHEPKTDEEKRPFRFKATSVTSNAMTVVFDEETEGAADPHTLKKDEMLTLTIKPPSWAGVQKRSLRFAAQIINIEGKSAEFAFHAEGSDLGSMIAALIPPKIVRKEKPMEVDFRVILLIILAVIIALMIGSTQTPPR